MSNNKLNKTNIWKNFIGFGILALIISLVFVFNIKIGFSVFEGFKTISLIEFIIIIIIVIINIIIVILAFLITIRKLNKEKEEINNAKN